MRFFVLMLKVMVFSLLCVATSVYAGDRDSQSNAQSNLTTTGGRIYTASAGEVILTFISKNAAYSNDLFLTGKPNAILNNQTAKPGTQFSLGSFAAGTELLFSMFVNNTGKTYFNGPASINPDSFLHAVYSNLGSKIRVGFEDIYGGGDKDYDDLVFSLSNVVVSTSAVPEPEVFGMLLIGLGILGFAKRKNS